MSYNFGDWVVYDPGYKREIGRVTELSSSQHARYFERHGHR